LLGFEPVVSRHATASGDYLAGSDEQRAADLNAALHDSSIRGIFALRGGYGTMRILDRLDYAQFARDPKCLAGFSDVTTLLNAFAQRCDAITFHSPVLSMPASTEALARMRRAFVDLEFPPLKGAAAAGRGRVQGVLRGGNLALVAAVCGTPYAVDMRGAILALEDVDVEPSDVDRELAQLRLAGALGEVRAIAVGDIPGRAVAEGYLRNAERPAITGLPFGHIDEQWLLPIGAQAEVDADAGTLTPLVTR
jgi:muramoyltetrapeptide carboxypeptidase